MNEETQTVQSDSEYAKVENTWFDPWKDREVSRVYRLRRPSRSDISRFNKEAGKSAGNAQNNLLMSLVHPEEKDGLKADLDLYPALMVTLASWALKASGLSDLGN